MEDDQLLRYSRQILLPQIDIAGQEKLCNSRVLIVGMGALGSPAAMYLAAAGVGELTLNDNDRVDLSNLQRQIIHSTPQLGRAKVESAADRLHALNPAVGVRLLAARLTPSELTAEAGRAHVVLDCSDNFTTRFAVNSACVATSTPLVSAAVVRFEGQISVFTPGHDHSPCYNCLYPRHGDQEDSCAQNGVIAPLPGILGSMQALETLKLLTGIGRTLRGRLLLLDALRMEWQTLHIPRNPACPTCNGSAPITL